MADIRNANVSESGGLELPIQASASGGFQPLTGDAYIKQLVRVLVADGDSDNPFQDVGFGIDAVFANLSDPAWKAQQRRKVKEVFDDLRTANLAKLDTVTFTKPGDDDAQGLVEGEIAMNIRFISIESNAELDVLTTVRRT